MTMSEPTIEAVRVSVYRVPTDAPEADGTLAWDSTTLVLVEVDGGGNTGLGYTYAGRSAALVIEDKLTPAATGRSTFDIAGIWLAMVGAVRNLGWRGVCACAISAIDWALWDLKAKLLDVSLFKLLGPVTNNVAIYGSGGFTSYDDRRLAEQVAGWVERDGCTAVKMKVGSEPERDPDRMRTARAAIGDAELYVDANGALERKQALRFADEAAAHGVTWFEEPVSSDDLGGLRLMRDRAPAGMDIAAGEYGYEPFYFRRMLDAQAVDVLQADATRCCGLTGFMKAAALAEAHSVPLSAHTAPALHVQAGCAVSKFKNIEWFHDHVRIEHMLFEGAPKPHEGHIAPDPGRPGLGLAFRKDDAARFAL